MVYWQWNEMKCLLTVQLLVVGDVVVGDAVHCGDILEKVLSYS